jgi:hypothetical protein
MDSDQYMFQWLRVTIFLTATRHKPTSCCSALSDPGDPCASTGVCRSQGGKRVSDENRDLTQTCKYRKARRATARTHFFVKVKVVFFFLFVSPPLWHERNLLKFYLLKCIAQLAAVAMESHTHTHTHTHTHKHTRTQHTHTHAHNTHTRTRTQHTHAPTQPPPPCFLSFPYLYWFEPST